MKRTRRSIEVFSLSFLDVISCGFGAIVLLLVIITAFGPSSQLGIWMNTELGLDKTLVSGSLIIVAITFSTAPQVARIVRGIVLDLKTRDYIAAAQTRGENPWYIMLWEVLPNARGPLIVDACLRIGYTTILLGTLGYFGLGMPPESPDWGTAIKDGSKVAQIRLYPWQGVVPAIALMSLVLGLNLLADALREESLKD